MHRWMTFLIVVILSASAIAGSKDTGQTTLKDIQPAGTTDKNHKTQQYDLSFISTSGKEYTCRTGDKTKVKATDFVVGSEIGYEIKDNKGKLKSGGKQVDCTVVRVANASAEPKPADQK